MRPKSLLFAFLTLLLLPVHTRAEVKTYDLTVLRVLNTTTVTITGWTAFYDHLGGTVEINDASNAAPTLESFAIADEQISTGRVDVFAGPNSFIYIRSLNTTSPVSGQTGTGDSEGFVKWNPLSSWTAAGGRFCKGSNEVGNPLGGPICTVLTFVDQGTGAATVPSTDYDFPLWTFDAQGDFSSDTVVWQISSNGSSNTEYFNRGLLRVNVPAMSLAGMAVLGASLMFLGARAMRRRD